MSEHRRLVNTFRHEKSGEETFDRWQNFLCDHLSEVVDQSFIDMYSNDPLENTFTAPERNIFSTDDRADEYARLVDASKETMHVDKEEDVEFELKVDRCLSNSVDPHHLASDSWGSEKVPKVELKQLPTGLKYAFLYDNSYSVVVNANLTSGELTLLLNKLCKYRKAIGYTLDDIPGISPDLCMRRIHLEDESKSSIEHQRKTESKSERGGEERDNKAFGCRNYLSNFRQQLGQSGTCGS